MKKYKLMKVSSGSPKPARDIGLPRAKIILESNNFEKVAKARESNEKKLRANERILLFVLLRNPDGRDVYVQDNRVEEQIIAWQNWKMLGTIGRFHKVHPDARFYSNGRIMYIPFYEFSSSWSDLVPPGRHRLENWEILQMANQVLKILPPDWKIVVMCRNSLWDFHYQIENDDKTVVLLFFIAPQVELFPDFIKELGSKFDTKLTKNIKEGHVGSGRRYSQE
jgi:hypothetical protein